MVTTTGKVNKIKDCLSQEELDTLLKGVTGETDCPESEDVEIAADEWAAQRMACRTQFELMDIPAPKPITLAKLIEKLRHNIECADRDISLILERRNATQDFLDDLLRLEE